MEGPGQGVLARASSVGSPLAPKKRKHQPGMKGWAWVTDDEQQVSRPPAVLRSVDAILLLTGCPAVSQTPEATHEAILLPSWRRARQLVETERENTSLKKRLAETKRLLAEARTQVDEKDAELALIHNSHAHAQLWPEERAQMTDQINALTKAALEKTKRVRIVWGGCPLQPER